MTTSLHPVHLVGAGPGDPELLTLKALRVLREATVILVDDLVGERVLEAALEGAAAPARIVHVGKRGGCASTPQDFIEKLMVREALAGERVVRLKGGDPLIFGRGGEEIEALRAAGVEVAVVNGITSGLGAAAALGIGWTDRRVDAQGVLLVTGHTRHDCDGQDRDAIGRVAAGRRSRWSSTWASRGSRRSSMRCAATCRPTWPWRWCSTPRRTTNVQCAGRWAASSSWSRRTASAARRC